jgi:hypothetical protein
MMRGLMTPTTSIRMEIFDRMIVLAIVVAVLVGLSMLATGLTAKPIACYSLNSGQICCYEVGCADIARRYGAD